MSKKASYGALGAAALLVGGASVLAMTNVDSTNKFAWGENIGFLNWADANGGADGVQVLGDHLTGFIWGENVGWINTGNGGGPYANTDNTDFGVNILGTGFCEGFAWGENIGWINFGTEPFVGGMGGARFDSIAGRFRGYAWGENVGWINLDDANVFVGVNAPACCPGNAAKESPGQVNFADITSVLMFWLTDYGAGNTGPGDSNCDGVVNFGDITSTLMFWLDSCP